MAEARASARADDKAKNSKEKKKKKRKAQEKRKKKKRFWLFGVWWFEERPIGTSTTRIGAST